MSRQSKSLKNNNFEFATAVDKKNGLSRSRENIYTFSLSRSDYQKMNYASVNRFLLVMVFFGGGVKLTMVSIKA